MKVIPYCIKNVELLNDQFGDTVEVNPSELYIKPIYSGKSICYYAVCSNLRNKEVELAEYCDTPDMSGKKCAKAMIYILSLYEDSKEEFTVLSATEVENWLKGMDRLLKAVRNQ